MLKVVLKSAQDFAMKSWESELAEGEWRRIRRGSGVGWKRRRRRGGGGEEGRRAGRNRQ